jgi:hypothetical protein
MSVVWLLLNKTPSTLLYCVFCGFTVIAVRPLPDLGDVGAYRNAGQVGAVRERKVAEAGDWQAVDCVREIHRTAWAGVSRDGYRAVIDYVKELGLHRGGQAQEQQQQQEYARSRGLTLV